MYNDKEGAWEPENTPGIADFNPFIQERSCTLILGETLQSGTKWNLVFHCSVMGILNAWLASVGFHRAVWRLVQILGFRHVDTSVFVVA